MGSMAVPSASARARGSGLPPGSCPLFRLDGDARGARPFIGSDQVDSGRVPNAERQVVGESARELRQRLGPPNTDIGVRLADGSVAIATWTTVLPATPDRSP